MPIIKKMFLFLLGVLLGNSFIYAQDQPKSQTVSTGLLTVEEADPGHK